MYDVIVIGGGPAGMAAALYALRNNKTVLVIEKTGFGGQITYSPKVENWPGILQMSGNEFAESFLEQIMAQGAELELAEVTGIEDKGDVKVVITEDGEFEAKAVIIAVGVKHRMLGIPGETEMVGNGISFCAVCDGDFYKGKTVAVIGGGNSALQEAMLLSDSCKEVIIVQNLDTFSGEVRLQEAVLNKANVKAIMGSTVKGLITDGEQFKGIEICRQADGQVSSVECDGIFVAIGLIPSNERFANVVPLNNWGYVDAGEDCIAGGNGIFAAGDCRSKTIRQLTTAVADGASAAVAACHYIDSL